MKSLAKRLSDIQGYARFAKWICENGLPGDVLYHGGGIGDELLMSSVALERKKRGLSTTWIMSRHGELFEHNRNVTGLIPWNGYARMALRKLGCPVVPLHYWTWDQETDTGPKPVRHYITEMCRLAGLSGEIVRRPYIELTSVEREWGGRFEGAVVIQPSSMGARLAMANKQWSLEKFQAVVDTLKGEFEIVQLGAASEPLMEGARDLRGATSVRESAAILSRARIFVGLEGFLMHLARAVECRSVIVYGGRGTPDIVGYSCNENLVTVLECSPCWRWNTCAYDRECMTRISTNHVLEATRRQLARVGEPLVEDSDFI